MLWCLVQDGGDVYREEKCIAWVGRCYIAVVEVEASQLGASIKTTLRV